MERDFHRLLRPGPAKHLAVPVDIDVILVGLRGDGGYGLDLDTGAFSEMLHASMTNHCPSYHAEDHLAVLCYSVSFNVHHVRADWKSLEADLVAAMKKAGVVHEPPLDPATDAERSIDYFKAEATAIEPSIDTLLAAHYRGGDGQTADDDDAEDHDDIDNDGYGTDSDHTRKLQGADAASGNSGSTSTKGGDAEKRRRLLLVVLNFDKARMRGRLAGAGDAYVRSAPYFAQAWDTGFSSDGTLQELDGNLRYTYSYAGRGASATWLSASSYLVVDLSAGPCLFGPEASPGGVVAFPSMPQIPKMFLASRALSNQVPVRSAGDGADAVAARRATAATLRSVLLSGELAATLEAGTRHVLLPDAAGVLPPQAAAVLLPVIVFRNHQAYNPLDPSIPEGISMRVIYEQISALAEVGQDVVVASGLHQLSSHPGIAVDVRAAMGTRTRAEYVSVGDDEDVVKTGSAVSGVTGRTEHYLDGDVLLERLAASTDALMDLLVSEGQGLTQDRYDAYVQERGRDEDTLAATALLPVFVLSLDGMPPGLQFAGGGLVYATQKAVLVLQPRFSYNADGAQRGVMTTGHFVDGTPLLHDAAKMVMPNIVAGVATAFRALVPPYEHHSVLGHHYVQDWLWGVGSSPFGPYTNTSTLSGVLRLACSRHLSASRMDAYLSRLHRATARVHAFITTHVALPFDDVAELFRSSEAVAQRVPPPPPTKRAAGPNRIAQQRSAPSTSWNDRSTIRSLRHLLGGIPKEILRLKGAVESYARATMSNNPALMSSRVRALNVMIKTLEVNVETQLSTAQEEYATCEQKVVHFPLWRMLLLLTAGCALAIVASSTP